MKAHKHATTAEETARCDFYYDHATEAPVEEEDLQFNEQGEPTNAAKVSFWLRPLFGRDEVAINNELMVADRKGRGKMMTGEVQRLKVVRSVVRVEGLENEDGSAVKQFAAGHYDGLRKWLCADLLHAVNELNGEVEEGE